MEHEHSRDMILLDVQHDNGHISATDENKSIL